MTKTKTDQRAVKRVSQATAAAVLGFKSAGSLRALVDAPRNRDRSYDLTALVPWFIARQAQGQEDPLQAAAGDNSPELEKWRRVRRQREEIELLRTLIVSFLNGQESPTIERVWTAVSASASVAARGTLASTIVSC